jgi:hypothetical protein
MNEGKYFSFVYTTKKKKKKKKLTVFNVLKLWSKKPRQNFLTW